MKSVGWGLVVAAGLLSSRGLLASEPPCMTTLFYGAEPSLEKTVRDQLRNELGTSVTKGGDGRACWRLIIEMRGGRVRLLLEADQIVMTELQLDDVLPALWPRAIALSAAGLFVLSRYPAGREVPPSEADTSRVSPEGVEGRGRGEEKGDEDAAAEPRAQGSTIVLRSTGVTHKRRRASAEARLHLLVGARLVPKFWAGTVEVLPGVGVLMGPVHLGLFLVGLWGRKSVDIGRIYTAGGGARLTLRGQLLRRNKSALWLGPAAEVIGLLGYGRETAATTSHTEVAPVVNVLCLFGASLALTPRLEVEGSLGLGWTLLYFQMQADDRNVSGMAGWLATLAAGVDFGI